MRFWIVILAILLLVACGEKKTDTKEPEPKEQATEVVPEDLGDSTAPVQVRALREAKEVKKQMEEKREEEKELLKERD